MTKLRILTDAQLLQALGKITGHQVPAGTPFGEGLAEQADFFYYLSSARVIHERIPARRELWAQKVYKTKLAMKLSETPGQICLVSDSDMVGEAALHFAVYDEPPRSFDRRLTGSHGHEQPVWHMMGCRFINEEGVDASIVLAPIIQFLIV